MRTRPILVPAVLGFLLLITNVAQAYHTKEQRLISGSAFTLRRNEWQLGLFRADYGIIPELQVGTYVVPWFALIPNIQVKARVFHNDRFAVSFRPGLFYIDLSVPRRIYGLEFGGADARIWAVPMEGYVSAIMSEQFTLTGQASYTLITGSGGTYDSDDYAGTGTNSNVQIGSVLEWRINRVAALLVTGRMMIYRSTHVAGDAEVDLDDRTVATVKADADADPKETLQIFSTSASMAFSWRHGDLRIGAGYGNYNVPGLNLVVGKPLPFPVFDAYIRF